MDLIPDKVWVVLAAVISSMGGFILFERKKVDRRLNKIERDMSQHKTDIAVIKEALTNLKEDTQEIKDLLMRRKK
jgi:hypothetical protein